MLPRSAQGHYLARAPSLGEDGDHELGESRVNTGDDAHHDQDEHDGNRRVGDQLLAGRPDHLPEFGPDLPHEDGRARALRLRRAAGFRRPAGLRAAYLSRHVLTCRADLWPYLAGWPKPSVGRLVPVPGPAGYEPTRRAGGTRTPNRRFWRQIGRASCRE